MEINVADITRVEGYHILTKLVAPRPIALVSTISRDGHVNLSPFSFFNLFSSNPPIVIFSPLLRRDGTRKHTLHNVMEVPEVVINIVTRDITKKASQTSFDYDDQVDEFTEVGFEKQKAIIVRPPMIKRAKAKLECKVVEIKPLGHGGGAGNLVICEVVYIHIADEVLDLNGSIDPSKLKPVARLGGDYYSEITEENMFSLSRPVDV